MVGINVAFFQTLTTCGMHGMCGMYGLMSVGSMHGMCDPRVVCVNNAAQNAITTDSK